MQVVHTKVLDAVRAVSALIVFFSHVIQIVWLPLVGLGSFVHRANSLISETAVIVFFVLSGYLISLSIHRNTVRNGGFSTSEYLRSRLLRIYPPFVGAVLVSIGVWVLFVVLALPGFSTPLRAISDVYAARENVSLTMGDVTNALTMRGGLLILNGPLWSLYIEVRLYVAAGAAAVLSSVIPSSRWRVPAAVIGFSVVSLLIGRGQPDYLPYAIWWLFGALFFFRQWLRREVLAVAGAVLLTGLLIASPNPVLLEQSRVVVVGLVSLWMFNRGAAAPDLFVRIGSFSYTLYLFHFPLLLAGYSLLILACDGLPSIEARLALTLIGTIFVLAVSRGAGSELENGPKLASTGRAIGARLRSARLS